METATLIIQVIIAVGIVNVWLVRYGRPSAWRAGEAKNMKEEFAAYGLPDWSVGVVGGLKVLLAAALIAAIWMPDVKQPAGVALAVLMLGAIVMHVRVKDPIKKSLPAFSMLVLSLVVAFV